MKRNFPGMVTFLLMTAPAWAQTGTISDVEPGDSVYTVDTINVVQPPLTKHVSMACFPEPCVYHEPPKVSRGKCTIAGTVRSRETAEPVPAAIVGVSYDYTDSIGATYITTKGSCAAVIADSLGRYVFQDFPPGIYHVAAKRSRYTVGKDTVSFISCPDSLYRIDFRLPQP